MSLIKVKAFNMNDKKDRELLVEQDWNNAKNFKANTTETLRVLNDYYNFSHLTKDMLDEYALKEGLQQTLPVLPDCFKIVEQSIDNSVPDFMFKGRDNDFDSVLAKEREEIVKYVLYNNNIEEMMPINERNLGKAKNAFWKVSWDSQLDFCGEEGDICIGNPNPSNIFPDPAAYNIDDCEYLIYAYRLHRNKARRIFGKVIDELDVDGNYEDTEIYKSSSVRSDDGLNNVRNYETTDYDDKTMQVLEYWFRQPENGSKKIDKVEYKWESGDIACITVIDSKEVKYIPKYYVKSNCNMFPFIKYCRVPNVQNFWDKSDIELIIDMVEAGNKSLASAILNQQFNGNDMIIAEEEALAKGSEISNNPGDVIQVRQGKINAIKRLGGLGNVTPEIGFIEWLQKQIEEVTGVSGINSGEKPPSNVTTFSGMALLAEQGQKRQENKKTSRTQGFKRLFELVDYHVIEFYEKSRFLTIRGADGIVKMFTFNLNRYQNTHNQKFEQALTELQQKGNVSDEEYYKLREDFKYYPSVDTEIILTDPIAQSKAMNVQAITEILKSVDNITPVKAKLLKAQIELMGLVDKAEIFKAIDEIVNMQLQQVQPQQQQGQASPVINLPKMEGGM